MIKEEDHPWTMAKLIKSVPGVLSINQETVMQNINQESLSSISLDSLDMQLIEQLKVDARQPIQAIAQVLGVSRETVRNRMNLLISGGALNIACVTKTERLGYEFFLVIGVRVRPGFIESVAKELVNLPGAISVSSAGSRYHIVVWAVLRDRREFVHFVSNDLQNVSNIMSVELMHSFYAVKQFWRIDKHFTEDIDDFTSDPLSDLDLSIIRAMQQDPRQTITALADTVGSSRSVARARLEELIQDGVIGFIPLVNRALLGYNNWVMILIKAQPDKMKAVVDSLSEQDATCNVTLVSGQWQVYSMALFQDCRASNKFTAEVLSLIPGITEFEVIPIVESFEHMFSPLPRN